MEHILKMIDTLGSKDAKFARKALNYYDGDQVEEMVKLLNDPSSFRKYWRDKGMIPRTRNITKAIVDKSGLLFSGNQPKLEVWVKGTVNEVASQSVLDMFDSAEWVEFFTNFDNMVRLLKTGLVLVQRTEDNKLVFDALHRGNCVVKMDPVTRQIGEVLFHLGDDQYRHFTPELITDYTFEDETNQLVIDLQVENTYGIVPVAVFHDTATPRTGVWNIAPADLIGLNEAYNLHLMESEYAAAWSKVKTLFTNADIDGDPGRLEFANIPGEAFPRAVPASSPAAVGGPGRIVHIETPPGVTPFVEYRGADVSFSPIDAMFKDWVNGFAGDWSVRLKTAGDGTASSGFQLIVEEMDNLELRKARQKMFAAGFARLYRVLTFVMQGVPGAVLPPEGQLYVTFGNPQLPVDDKAQEELWSRRITEGRATRVDYFIEVHGMTREEAMTKVAEIDALNSVNPVAPTRNMNVRVI